jgi:hypothetical protein
MASGTRQHSGKSLLQCFCSVEKTMGSLHTFPRRLFWRIWQPKLNMLSQHFFFILVRELSNTPHNSIFSPKFVFRISFNRTTCCVKYIQNFIYIVTVFICSTCGLVLKGPVPKITVLIKLTFQVSPKFCSTVMTMKMGIFMYCCYAILLTYADFQLWMSYLI